MKKLGHNGKVTAWTCFVFSFVYVFFFFYSVCRLDQNGMFAIPPGP